MWVVVVAGVGVGAVESAGGGVVVAGAGIILLGVNIRLLGGVQEIGGLFAWIRSIRRNDIWVGIGLVGGSGAIG